MNVLILEKGCQDCSFIKVNLDMAKVENDEFEGRNGEKICIFFTLSSAGSRELLQRLGVDAFPPVMLSSSGEVLCETDEILKKINLFGYGK